MGAIKHKMIWLIMIIFVITGCASIEKAESLHRQGEKQAALEMAISLLEDDSSKVRLGRVGEHHLSEDVISVLNDKWQEVVVPVTGFESYEDLIASLAL